LSRLNFFRAFLLFFFFPPTFTSRGNKRLPPCGWCPVNLVFPLQFPSFPLVCFSLLTDPTLSLFYRPIWGLTTSPANPQTVAAPHFPPLPSFPFPPTSFTNLATRNDMMPSRISPPTGERVFSSFPQTFLFFFFFALILLVGACQGGGPLSQLFFLFGLNPLLLSFFSLLFKLTMFASSKPKLELQLFGDSLGFPFSTQKLARSFISFMGARLAHWMGTGAVFFRPVP